MDELCKRNYFVILDKATFKVYPDVDIYDYDKIKSDYKNGRKIEDIASELITEWKKYNSSRENLIYLNIIEKIIENGSSVK